MLQPEARAVHEGLTDHDLARADNPGEHQRSHRKLEPPAHDLAPLLADAGRRLRVHVQAMDFQADTAPARAERIVPAIRILLATRVSGEKLIENHDGCDWGSASPARASR